MATKLITIVGITGNQGASVADAFLNEAGWKVRGISRDISKSLSKAWSDKGVEMVGADLDDVASLKAAFQGSNAIFGVTDFWQHVANPANHQKAAATGKTINVIAYEAEILQGKNIVDAAAATKDTLDTLVLSVLSESKKYSHGRITWNYHFDGKWEFVKYLQKTYPDLYEKTSLFQAGFYTSNLESHMAPQKGPDGEYIFAFPIDGDAPIPIYHARNDTGPLVKALFKSSPGKNLMGYSEIITFNEIAQIWAEKLGKPLKYQRCTVEDLDQVMPGGVGREIGEMMEYMSNPGYFGGQEAVKELGLVEPKELRVTGLTDVRAFLQALKI